MVEKGAASKKIAYAYFGIVGFLMVFFCKACEDLERQGNIIWSRNYVLSILTLSVILGGALGVILCFLLCKLANVGGKAVKTSQIGNRLAEMKDSKFFLLSFALIVLSFVPAYLAFYPGICAYDTIYQLDQAANNYFIEHHPLVHTLLLKSFFVLGRQVFASAGVGITLYVILQVLVLSATFSCALTAVHHYRVKWYWQILGIVYCVCYPFHHYLGVSVTKDVIFSAFFLLTMVLFYGESKAERNQWKLRGRDVLLLGGIVGIVLFRNNGKYALLVVVCFLLLAFIGDKRNRSMWGRLLLVTGAALLVGQMILTCVFRFSGAEQGDKREMLSMPIQQLARTTLYHGGVGVLEEDDNTMEEVDKALINDFLLDESYRFYNPILSDPVKTHTNTYVVRYRPIEFVKTYLNLLRSYLGDFVNAALAVNGGYFNPEDESHTLVYEREGMVGEGYVAVAWAEDILAEWGIYKDSKWPWLYGVMEKWADENAYLNIPILKYLFVPGVYLWLYLVLVGYLLICKKNRYMLPLTLVFGYFVTLLLGPTVQLRYIYPLMITLPFYAMLSCQGGKESGKSD